jgi:hypothetical protein
MNFPAYQCDYHGSVRVQFIAMALGDVTSYTWTSLICRFKETNYRVNFYHGKLDPTHPKFSIAKIPFDNRKPSETIFTLDFHPDITPENVESKLPVYLTFS